MLPVSQYHDQCIQTRTRLTYTPRGFGKNKHDPYFYTIESDRNIQKANEAGQHDTKQPPPEHDYTWTSCINVLDVSGNDPKVVSRVDIEAKEAAVSIAFVSTATWG